LENSDELAVIDTQSNEVIANIPIGQAPQALVFVSNAVPGGDGLTNLQQLGVAGEAAHLTLAPLGATGATPMSVSLFDQGLVQVLQAAVTGLAPGQHYVIALSNRADGRGELQPLASFTANPAGAAIVNATGPIRQLVHGEDHLPARYLVIAPGTAENVGAPIQVQQPGMRA
jgi:YVTN family beta-propeller protein